MIVRLDIPDEIGSELASYAQRHGFASAKQMLVAHIKEAVKHERQDKRIEARPKLDAITTDDVVIG